MSEAVDFQPGTHREMSELAAAIEQLREALEVEGQNPSWHRRTMRRHRKEWPMLWLAIDRLLLADNEEGTRCC